MLVADVEVQAAAALYVFVLVVGVTFAAASFALAVLAFDGIFGVGVAHIVVPHLGELEIAERMRDAALKARLILTIFSYFLHIL